MKSVIELAKEAKFPSLTEYGYECLERFAALVRAERHIESVRFLDCNGTIKLIRIK